MLQKTLVFIFVLFILKWLGWIQQNITFRGKALTLKGKLIQVGKAIPNVRLTDLELNMVSLNSIKGKELTPFLIKEINNLSENKTLEANIELIINNNLIF